MTGSGAVAPAGASGRMSSKDEPPPGVLRTRTEPWWALAMACTMARPSPNPPVSRLRCGLARANRWKIRSRSAGSMPVPESATIRATCPSLRRALTSIWSPAAGVRDRVLQQGVEGQGERSRSAMTVTSVSGPSRHWRGR